METVVFAQDHCSVSFRAIISALMRIKIDTERQIRDPAVSEQEMPEKDWQAKESRAAAGVCLSPVGEESDTADGLGR